MSATFATPEWADSFATSLRGDAALSTDARTWVHGPITLVVDGATALRVDVHQGEVRSVTSGAPGEVALAPFELRGTVERWKSVLGGAPTIYDAVLQSKLQVRGDLPTLARHRGMLEGIVRSAAAVPTSWPGDDAPA